MSFLCAVFATQCINAYQNVDVIFEYTSCIIMKVCFF